MSNPVKPKKTKRPCGKTPNAPLSVGGTTPPLTTDGGKTDASAKLETPLYHISSDSSESLWIWWTT